MFKRQTKNGAALGCCSLIISGLSFYGCRYIPVSIAWSVLVSDQQFISKPLIIYCLTMKIYCLLVLYLLCSSVAVRYSRELIDMSARRSDGLLKNRCLSSSLVQGGA